MSKPFDEEFAQRRAERLRVRMRGRAFCHYKGGLYRVREVAVRESDGHIEIIYESIEKGYVWSRTFNDFTAWIEIWGEDKIEYRVMRFSPVAD